MSDLIPRLRNAGARLSNPLSRICDDAADRIEQLEAALKLVACNCTGEAGCKSYELYYKLCPDGSPASGGADGG